jgi:hypothetical protein
MKKIGLALDKFEHSELSYFAIKSANEVVSKGIDVVGFYKNVGVPTIKPMFACMQFAESFSYYGDIVATSFNTALAVMTNPFPKKRYLYLWDLDWLRKPAPYDYYAKVYLNKEFILVARTSHAAKVIAQCWNREVAFINHDFNLERFF